MRTEVLERVRAALEGRERLARPHVRHPDGSPDAQAQDPTEQRGTNATPIADFRRTLEAAGGEVLLFTDLHAAREWAGEFVRDFAHCAQSDQVPEQLRLDVPLTPPDRADLGVSWALRAAADTGSVVLGSSEGRRLQILPPVHLVWVEADRVRAHLGVALREVREGGQSALALHSGPSKSADIGRMVVTGVHGPARIVVAILPVVRES